MKVGGDFFLILNFVVKLIRLFFEVFGDDDDKKASLESKKRSGDGTGDAC